MTGSKPNIVFITTHDLGQHLGCYGQKTVLSPNLDRLAREGVRFARSFATGPTCSPSRAALHTGRYAHSNGVMGLARPLGWDLGPGEKHFARLACEAGYATALVGLQHVAQKTARLGYERIEPLAPAPKLAKSAVKVLRELSAGDRPFYLEVGFHEPHRPYEYGGAEPEDRLGAAVPPYLPDTPEARQDMAAAQGSIRLMDEAVGEIMAALEECGQSDRTWVVFTTDHGLPMPRAKSTLYDPGLEAALLMRWPKAGLAGGIVRQELVSNVDIVPTLLEGMGLPVPDRIQGVSLWPLLQGTGKAPRDAVYAEKNYHTQYEPMRGIRTERHKLIVNLELGPKVNVPSDVQMSPVYPLMIRQSVNARSLVELFDLEADPDEMNNLADDAAHAGIRDELMQRLLRWMEDTEDPILRGPVLSPYYLAAMDVLKRGGAGV